MSEPNWCCDYCGRAMNDATGWVLRAERGDDLMCPDCAKKFAPRTNETPAWTRMLEQLGALDVLIADPATTEADREAAKAAHATLLARAVEARLGVAGRAVTERRLVA